MLMEIPHILVAEDDPDTGELMELVLHRAGFRVTLTGDPYKVLDLLATGSFDSLLLDNWMPKRHVQKAPVVSAWLQRLLVTECLVRLSERRSRRLGRRLNKLR